MAGSILIYFLEGLYFDFDYSGILKCTIYYEKENMALFYPAGVAFGATGYEP
jgi:hypothetical protein